MNAWTDDETRELINLWQTQSAGLIAKRMDRPRSAVCGKVSRLRRQGVLSGGGGSKHFDIPPRPPTLDDSLAMQPCVLLELDHTRCHWPLGDTLEVAVLSCGGRSAPGRRFCLHHQRFAQRN